MKFKVSEIFESLQGEGARAGELSIFIRLSGCNYKCNFCDTSFNEYQELTLPQIASIIKQYRAKWIVWTGGEPTLQLNNSAIRYFANLGYKQAIESNGSNKIPDGLDYITISPKQKIHYSIEHVNEIRIVFPDIFIKSEALLPDAEHYFLSPRFDGQNINYTEILNCINYIKEYPKWKLSIQQHKIWNMQ